LKPIRLNETSRNGIGMNIDLDNIHEKAMLANISPLTVKYQNACSIPLLQRRLG